MRKLLCFALSKNSLILALALMVLAVFSSQAAAATYDFEMARIEYREYGTVEDHTRLAFILQDMDGVSLPYFRPDLRPDTLTLSYQEGSSWVPITPHSGRAVPTEGLNGRYDKASQEWIYGDSFRLDWQYKFILYPQDPNADADYSDPENPATFPIAPTGTYKLDLYFDDYGETLTTEMNFPGPNWQPRPIVTDQYFDHDGNLWIEWISADDEESPVGFDEGSTFKLDIEFGIKDIQVVVPTCMDYAFIPEETFALLGLGLDDEFIIGIRSQNDDWTTRTMGPTNFLTPGELDVRAAPVPEPTTMLLLGIGLVGLAGVSRKRFIKN